MKFRLRCDVRFTLGRYRGREWPPSPRRVFLALIAATPGNVLVRLLEGAAPRIWLPPGMLDLPASANAQYHPGNEADRANAAAAKPGVSHADARAAAKRGMLALTRFPDPRDVLTYSWELDISPAEGRELARSLRMTVLGRGDDFVFATFKEGAPEPDGRTALVPGYAGGGALYLQVPAAGLRADALERHAAAAAGSGGGAYASRRDVRRVERVAYGAAGSGYAVFELGKACADAGALLGDAARRFPAAKLAAMPSRGGYGDGLVRRLACLGDPDGVDGGILRAGGEAFALERRRGEAPATYAGSERRWATVSRVRASTPGEAVALLPPELREGAVASLGSPRGGKRFVSYDFERAVPGPISAGGSPLAREPAPRLAAWKVAGRRPGTLRLAETGASLRRAVARAVERKFGSVPPLVSGHSPDGGPAREHFFWLPLDSDGDGFVDEMAAYAPGGIPLELADARVFEGIRGLDDGTVLAFGGFRRFAYGEEGAPAGAWACPNYVPHRWPKAGLTVVDMARADLGAEFADAEVEAFRQPAAVFDHRGVRMGRPAYFVRAETDARVRDPPVCGLERHFGLGRFMPAGPGAGGPAVREGAR